MSHGNNSVTWGRGLLSHGNNSVTWGHGLLSHGNNSVPEHVQATAMLTACPMVPLVTPPLPPPTSPTHTGTMAMEKDHTVWTPPTIMEVDDDQVWHTDNVYWSTKYILSTPYLSSYFSSPLLPSLLPLLLPFPLLPCR